MTYPNEPAFPMTSEESNKLGAAPGLTKREYFAGLAMQGIISARSHPDVIAGSKVDFAMFAEFCVEHADALIAELSKAK